MDDLISKQAAIKLIHSLYPSAPIMRINRKRWKEKYKPYIEAEKALEQLLPAQPEQKVEELLPDGTLHLFTDTDLSKVNRVWVSQNNTHYGDLYYTDEDPKRGKWIPCTEQVIAWMPLPEPYKERREK